MKQYKTIENAASVEIIEKKSRFIGYASPVETEQQAIDFVASIRKKHPDARHNVYAYSLREDSKQRYSDDGEPQGTAGRPVLDILRKSGITDCAIVVTRYFGGILLGTGGLVRAYSQTAKAAVEAGSVIEMSICSRCRICCDYNKYGMLQNHFSEFGCVVENSDFADSVTIDFYLESDQLQRFMIELSERTAATVKAEQLGECYLKTICKQ